jgi:tetratricopeptide (TPR) repeat protein
MPATESMSREERIQSARRWIEIGNDRRARAGATLQESLEAYDKAVELVSPLCDSETSPVRDDLASAWINRGIALMHDGSGPSLRQSIRCFDKAIELRSTLLGLDDPWFRYNLIGVWINRGDALARFGDDAARAASLASYDEAIRLGSRMESDPRPKVAWRLALAHLNRGATLLQLGGNERLADAGCSFDSSIAALGASEDSQRLIAAYAWEGKAEVLGHQGSDAEARTCARRAMALVSGLEPGALDATIVGLKARIALCANSWRALSAAGGSTMDRNEAADALDAADEGLRIAFGWPATRQMESLIVELFRFGSLGYASLQPQFLGEFIGDFVKPTLSAELGSALRPLAIQALRNAIGKLAGDGLMRAGLSDSEIATFAELRRTLESLGQR